MLTASLDSWTSLQRSFRADAPVQVYKANLDGMNDVAIKLLKPETVGSESSVRKFLAEIDVLRACRDPHIVAFYGGWAQKVRDMPHAWPKQSRRLGAAPWRHIHSASGILICLQTA